MTGFGIDQDGSINLVLLVVVVGLLLDRALSTLFESRAFLRTRFARHRSLLTLAGSIALAIAYRIDVFAMIQGDPERVTPVGLVVTGVFMASVTTGSTRIVSDIFLVRSNAQELFAAQRKAPGTDRLRG